MHKFKKGDKLRRIVRDHTGGYHKVGDIVTVEALLAGGYTFTDGVSSIPGITPETSEQYYELVEAAAVTTAWYVQVYKNTSEQAQHNGAAPYNAHIVDDPKHRSGLMWLQHLTTYELEPDGGLTLYEKPAEPLRYFATQDHSKRIGHPIAQDLLNFDSTTATYYEIMPNGDYRKVSPGERHILRADALRNRK